MSAPCELNVMAPEYETSQAGSDSQPEVDEVDDVLDIYELRPELPISDKDHIEVIVRIADVRLL